MTNLERAFLRCAFLYLSVVASMTGCYQGTSQSSPDGQDAQEIEEDQYYDEEETSCLERPLIVNPEFPSTSCPEETRVGETIEVLFEGSGRGCDCGGSVDTELEIWASSVPIHENSVMIWAHEIVCDPSQCCEECNCVDTYEVSVEISFDKGGTYRVMANGEHLCTIDVLDEEGCLVQHVASVEVVDYTEEVVSIYGDDAEAVFNLRVSSGRCCEAEPIVYETITLDAICPVDLHPRIKICEGDCCDTCECVDSYDVEHVVRNIGWGSDSCHVCVEGEDCYVVRIIRE